MSAISTFAELADLMEPEWNVKHITTTWPKEPIEVVVELFKRESPWFTWEILRRIPLQFAKLSASASGDTQTIHITLEPIVEGHSHANWMIEGGYVDDSLL